MTNDRVEIPYEFVLDEQSEGRIENALEAIAKKQQIVTQQFEKGNLALSEATAVQQKLNTEKQQLLTLQKAANAEADLAEQKQRDLLNIEQQRVEASKANLRAKQDQFDLVSRDVSLAGDFQSNLGALRGLSSAAGLGGVSQTLDITGESVALIEELPRLLATMAGMPATLQASIAAINALKGAALVGLKDSLLVAKSAAVSAAQGVWAFIAGLGPLGWAIAATVVVVTALIAALAWLKGSSDKAKEATEAMAKAEELTTKQAEDRLSQIETEKQRIQELIAVREENGLKTDDLKDKEKELTEETEGLTYAVESGATATNDAIEAEKALAAERSAAALEAGEDAASLEEIRQKVRDSNNEELEALIQDINDRKAVLEAERAAIIATGDTSEETQAKLADLNDGIGDLEEQLNLATSSTSRAAAAENSLTEEREEAAKEAAREAEQRAKDEKKAAEDRAKAAAKASADAANEIRKRAEKIRDVTSKANDDLLKLQEDYNKEVADAFLKATRDELKEQRSANRDKKDLLKQLGRDEKDLIATGDIFSIADLREKASEGLSDLREDYDFDAKERAIARQQEALDRLNEARDQRQKLRDAAIAQLNDLGVANKAIRTGWRSMLTGLGNDINQFKQAISLSGKLPNISNTNTTNVGVSVSMDGAPLRALINKEIAIVG